MSVNRSSIVKDVIKTTFSLSFFLRKDFQRKKPKSNQNQLTKQKQPNTKQQSNNVSRTQKIYKKVKIISLHFGAFWRSRFFHKKINRLEIILTILLTGKLLESEIHFFGLY